MYLLNGDDLKREVLNGSGSGVKVHVQISSITGRSKGAFYGLLSAPLFVRYLLLQPRKTSLIIRRPAFIFNNK